MNPLPSVNPARKHLLFLDGLRGLAALYVVAHHALLQITETYPRTELPRAFLAATKWLLFGQMSVDVFIVLSGFCLMLPVARGDGHLRGGLLSFVKRRSRRILPPYYAAVVISLLLIACVPSLSHPENRLWSLSLPAFTPAILLTHLFLVHNVSTAWFHKIDYPLWSVATEWQIYFVFALLLLPVWRRFGVLATIGAAFAVAYLPRLFFHHRLDQACFHFLGLFAFGMGAAILVYSKNPTHKAIAGSPIWGIGCGAAGLAFVVLAAFKTKWLLAHAAPYDLLIGIATACFLFMATRQSQGMAPPKKFLEGLVTVLEYHPVVALGTFSYSLYLIHAPLLALVFSGVSRLHLSAAASFLASEAAGLPVCIGVAYGFHLAFERPFMSMSGPKTEKEAEVAAIVSPSP